MCRLCSGCNICDWIILPAPHGASWSSDKKSFHPIFSHGVKYVIAVLKCLKLAQISPLKTPPKVAWKLPVYSLLTPGAQMSPSPVLRRCVEELSTNIREISLSREGPFSFLKHLLVAISELDIYKDTMLNFHSNTVSRREIGTLVCKYQATGSFKDLCNPNLLQWNYANVRWHIY